MFINLKSASKSETHKSSLNIPGIAGLTVVIMLAGIIKLKVLIGLIMMALSITASYGYLPFKNILEPLKD